jgi:uncharacterized protein
MSAKPKLKFDPAAVTELACPACRGDLRASPEAAPASLICSVCGRAYPVLDGIPVLVVERAEMAPGKDKPAPGE